MCVVCGCREGSDYERVLKVNVVGSFLVTQAFYGLLKKRATRTIVNVSSGVGSIAAQRAGSVPVAGKVVAYASCKAALNMRARPRCASSEYAAQLWCARMLT